MIQRIAVVGAGTMGCGIAQLCAQHGFSVKLHDAVPEALKRVPQRLKEGLDQAVLRGKLTIQQADRAFYSVSVVGSPSELAGADLVIEAASEDLSVKRKIFQDLDVACPEAILATNTSSLAVSAIAAGLSSPERVLGMHFFNPPVAMKLIEMVRTPQTGPEVYKAAWDFALMGLRKTPVDVKDTPGFIVNRVMRPFYLGAMREAGEAGGILPLDNAAKQVGQVPMAGPFELMDLIGLDVNLAITKSIYEALGRPERLLPNPIQEKLVAMGHIGRKAGQGFYLYRDGLIAGENPEAVKLISAAPRIEPEAIWGRLFNGIVLEAQKAAEEGVAGKNDIDVAIKLAMNFPKGPFEWLKQQAPQNPAATGR